MTNSLSNMISSINNASKANLATLTFETSKYCIRVLDVFRKGGYIRGYRHEASEKERIIVTVLLKYTEQGSAIRELKRISSPGKRVYWSVRDIRPIKNGLGSLILSTSRGILYDTEAKLLGVGGEVLCYIS